MAMHCIGIDLGGTTIKFGLFNLEGHLIDKWQTQTDTSEKGKYILRDIATSMKEKLDKLQINISILKGIGMGVPGLVTSDGVVTAAVNLGWTNVSVAQELAELMGIPVKVGNDANAAALGEMWQGSGRGHKNLVMITLGTGIGGGVIVEGKIVSGMCGAAGEFGHIPIVHDETEICRCGRKGCLEQAASAKGIVKEAKRLLEESTVTSLLRGMENISSHSIFEAAKAGDKIAVQAVERAGKFLGIAMATITGVLDPEIYIIGGGVSNAGQYLIDIIEKYYRKNVLYASKDTKITLAELGNDAGIYGAARMIW